MATQTTASPVAPLPFAPLERAGSGPPHRAAEPPVSNARLAVILLIGAGVMLFTAFIGAFVLFRVSNVAWPPPGLPYLPVGVTWVNTAVLLLSALAMRNAVRSIRADRRQALCRGLAFTLALGATFLIVQGTEWMRLIGHGLTLSSGAYGSIFYALVGLHALHVLAAVTWLSVVTLGAYRGRYSADEPTGVEVCGLYWYFLCGLWVVLFILVYLS